MFKRVDEEKQDLEGYVYQNLHEEDEFVAFRSDNGAYSTVIVEASDETVEIYIDDIPKLIKALQAAYDYKRSEKDGYK